MNKTPRFALIVLLALSLLVAACGTVPDGMAGDAGGGQDPTQEPAVEEPGQPTEAAAATDAPIPSPSGRIIFLSERDGDKDLYLVDAAGNDPQRLTFAASLDGMPRWSPDAGRVAFASTVNGNTDIYIVNADGTNLTRLTDDPGKDSSPSWSPDGTRIVFESNRDDNFELYIIRTDGSGLTRLTNDPAGDFNPHWSPVGEQIAFVNNSSGNSDICIINSDSSGWANLTSDALPSSDPVWSPDGASLAYRLWPASDTARICVIGADRSNPRCLTPAGTVGIPAWSQNSARLAFLATHEEAAGIDILQVSDGQINSITFHEVEARGDPSWSPENAYIVFQANADGDMELFLLTVNTNILSRLTSTPGYDGDPAWVQ
jgi:Tol biopolymer transport system component